MVVTWPLSNRILDVITTTNPNLVNNIENHTGISDHLLVTFDICMKIKHQTKPPRKLFHFQKADTNNPKSKDHNLTQEFVNSNPNKNSVDTNWEIIQHNPYTIMERNVPWKSNNGKRLLPRINVRIKGGMRKRDKLHCRGRKYQDVVHWDHFHQCRNKVAKMVQKLIITEQPKSFWSYFKLIQTENNGIPTVRTQTKLCTTDIEKADT